MADFARILVTSIDRINNALGKATALFALAIVVLQFIIVLMRYIFGVGSIFIQESIIYSHAALFMLGAGYTLLHDGHVRLDIFYRTARTRIKNIINVIGSLVFLIPTSIVIGVYSWPYVAQSWRVFEGSKETSGIPAVFLLKTVVLAFAALVCLQGISLAVRSFCALIGRPLGPAIGTESPPVKP